MAIIFFWYFFIFIPLVAFAVHLLLMEDQAMSITYFLITFHKVSISIITRWPRSPSEDMVGHVMRFAMWSLPLVSFLVARRKSFQSSVRYLALAGIALCAAPLLEITEPPPNEYPWIRVFLWCPGAVLVGLAIAEISKKTFSLLK
jgi:hypothetical protein